LLLLAAAGLRGPVAEEGKFGLKGAAGCANGDEVAALEGEVVATVFERRRLTMIRAVRLTTKQNYK
jgi:hypothetical protein